MAKNKTVQIFAFLALFGIIISIVGTGLIIFFWDTTQPENIYIPEEVNTFTQEDIEKIVDEQEVEVTNSGVLEVNK